jgi:hypothetical protein
MQPLKTARYQGHPIQAAAGPDGKVWWKAHLVCRALGLGEARRALVGRFTPVPGRPVPAEHRLRAPGGGSAGNNPMHWVDAQGVRHLAELAVPEAARPFLAWFEAEAPIVPTAPAPGPPRPTRLLPLELPVGVRPPAPEGMGDLFGQVVVVADLAQRYRRLRQRALARRCDEQVDLLFRQLNTSLRGRLEATETGLDVAHRLGFDPSAAQLAELDRHLQHALGHRAARDEDGEILRSRPRGTELDPLVAYPAFDDGVTLATWQFCDYLGLQRRRPVVLTQTSPRAGRGFPGGPPGGPD